MDSCMIFSVQNHFPTPSQPPNFVSSTHHSSFLNPALDPAYAVLWTLWLALCNLYWNSMLLHPHLSERCLFSPWSNLILYLLTVCYIPTKSVSLRQNIHQPLLILVHSLMDSVYSGDAYFTMGLTLARFYCSSARFLNSRAKTTWSTDPWATLLGCYLEVWGIALRLTFLTSSRGIVIADEALKIFLSELETSLLKSGQKLWFYKYHGCFRVSYSW